MKKTAPGDEPPGYYQTKKWYTNPETEEEYQRRLQWEDYESTFRH